MSQTDIDKDIREPMSASYMSGGKTGAPSGDYQVLNVSDEFVLAGVSVKQIVHDFKERGFDKIPSMEALNGAVDSFNDLYEKAENLLNMFRNPYLISDPLVSTNLIDKNVYTENVSLDQDQATITKNSLTPPYALIVVHSDAFSSPGKHYFELNIRKMTSPGSKVTIRNERDVVLREIMFAGKHRFVFDIEIPSVTTLTIQVDEMPDNGEIVIEGLYIYSIKDNIDRYMQFIQDQSTGGDNPVTLEQVLQLLEDYLAQSKAYSNQVTANVAAQLNEHANNHNNPHRVTYEQTGAAAKQHTHNPGECGAAPVQHKHTLADIDFGNIDLDALTSHIMNTDNPHSVTKDQVGLGELPNAKSDDPNLDDGKVLATTKATAVTSQALATHISNVDNPHATSKMHVGLSDVENYPPGTLQEHIDGTSTERYNIPAYTKAAFEAWANSGVDVSKIQPKPVYKFVFTGEKITVPTIEGRIYYVQLTPKSEPLLAGLHINFDVKENDYITGDPTYSTAFIYTTPSVAPYLAYKEVTGTYVPIIPEDVAHNYGSGVIMIDTSTLQMSGDIACRVLNTDTNEFVSNVVIRNKFDASIIIPYQADISEVSRYVTGISFDFVNADPNANVEIQIAIYEHLLVQNEPTMVIDAFPVGYYVAIAGNIPKPGYGFLDGSELNRDNYASLYKHASEQGLIIPDQDYEAFVVEGGDVWFYSDGDGENTFKIPKLVDHTEQGKINGIKLRDVTVPEHAQVIYELIQSDEQSGDLP